MLFYSHVVYVFLWSVVVTASNMLIKFRHGWIGHNCISS